MKKLKDRLFFWYTNRCCECPCGWEDVGMEDCDQGCHVFRHFGSHYCPYALLPFFVRRLLRRVALRRDARDWERSEREGGDGE